MIQISIHPDIEYKAIADEYALLLKLWKKELKNFKISFNKSLSTTN